MSESDFTPDRDALDEEWVRQPELYHQYAVDLADARLDLEEKKNKLEVIRAELDKDIRTSPEDYELQKITETAISATILTQSRYTKGLERVNKARHRVDVLTAAVTALDHKKKALENLVYLHGQDYFSSPKAKGENSEEMDRAARKIKAGKGPKLTRKNLREDEDE